jgi:hypothetical protein
LTRFQHGVLDSPTFSLKPEIDRVASACRAAKIAQSYLSSEFVLSMSRYLECSFFSPGKIKDSLVRHFRHQTVTYYSTIALMAHLFLDF